MMYVTMVQVCNQTVAHQQNDALNIHGVWVYII